MCEITPTHVVMNWVSAYNTHKASEAAELYATEVINTQMPWGKSILGKEAMRNTFLNVFKTFPDVHIEVENLFENGEWVTLEWRFSGTMHGEFAGHSPTGRSFTLKGCEIFQIKNGKIFEQHGYWDKATMLSQLGIRS